MVALPENPIYHDLTRDRKNTSMRIALLSGGLAALVVLGVMISGMQRISVWQQLPNAQTQPAAPAIFYFGLFAWIVTICAPVIAYLVSLRESHRYLASNSRNLIELTHLTKKDVNRGLRWGIDFRLRWVWTVMLTMLPAAVVVVGVYQHMGNPFYGPLKPLYYLPLMLKSLTMVLIFWGYTAASISLGIFVARKQPRFQVVGSAGVLALCLGTAYTGYFLLTMTFGL